MNKIILKMKSITPAYYFLAITFLVLIFQSIYLSYLYYNLLQEEKVQIGIVSEFKADAEKFEKMSASSGEPTAQDRLFINRRYKQPIKNAIGAEISKVVILKKASRKSEPNVFFKVKFDYRAVNIDSVKRLVAVLLMDEGMYLISNINSKEIYAVIKLKKKGVRFEK